MSEITVESIIVLPPDLSVSVGSSSKRYDSFSDEIQAVSTEDLTIVNASDPPDYSKDKSVEQILQNTATLDSNFGI